VGNRERRWRRTNRGRGITLEEKKTRKKDERDERERDAEFRFPPAVVLVRSMKEGMKCPKRRDG